jgi:hypothetical protein
MSRVFCSWLACFAVIGLGLSTAVLSASNRARGSELDRLERWCETRTRQNELLRVENARREWLLLGAAQEGPDAEVAP